ncbi:MAG: adenylate kinase [Dehalococcoidia bacterium]
MTRIAIVGSSCSGKTTLARQVAESLIIPHIELDALHWLPHWTERPDEEFRGLVRQAVAGDSWVADGNYLVAQDLVWGRATMVIWLNYSFRVVFQRALSRTVRRVFGKEELFSGNRESFRQAFLSRESIIWWVLTTYRARNRRYRAIFERREFPHLEVIELRNPKAANELLVSLAKDMHRPG